MAASEQTSQHAVNYVLLPYDNFGNFLPDAVKAGNSICNESVGPHDPILEHAPGQSYEAS